jgi:hypothetical protein
MPKLTSDTITTEDSPPSSKKAKKQSSNQVDNSADSAMIASSVSTYRSTKQQQSNSNQPQKCKHCGKYVKIAALLMLHQSQCLSNSKIGVVTD